MMVRTKRTLIPNAELALGRLQAVWSLTSALVHALLLIALLKAYEKEVVPVTPPWNFEFIEVSLQPAAKEQLNEVTDATPPEEKIIPTQEKNALIIKVKESKQKISSISAKPQVLDNSYGAQLSRHVYRDLKKINFQAKNKISIWLSLNHQGIIQKYGFTFEQPDPKLHAQLEEFLKSYQPMLPPTSLVNGELVTYLVPMILE